MKNVQFNKIVSVILIPSKEEYLEIFSEIWYTNSELELIRKYAMYEINIFRSFNVNVNFTDAKRMLYN